MRLIILSLIGLTICQTFAQNELGAFTATGRAGVGTTMLTDYQCVGINPANLDFESEYENKRFNLGLMEQTFSISSEALKKSELEKTLFDFDKTEFNYQQKKEAAQKFINSPLSVNYDMNIIGLAIRVPKVGGFAFNIRDRIQWYSKFGQEFSNMLFLGYNNPYFTNVLLNNGTTVPNNANLSDVDRANIVQGLSSTDPTKILDYNKLLEGTKITFSYFREFNLSYGKELIKTESFQLYAGAGIKYIQALASIDIDGTKGLESISKSYATAIPYFGVNFSDQPKASQAFNPFQSIGNGFGVDLGTTVILKEKLKIGLALNNFGTLAIKGDDLYKIKDTVITTLKNEGSEGYNIFNQFDKYGGQDGYVKWQKASGTTKQLPALIRAGASLRLLDGKIEPGIDIVVPLNTVPGSLVNPQFAIGGDFRPIKWIKLSTGTTYGGTLGNFAVVPFGVTFILGALGSVETGIASRDIITYFTKDNPVISLSTGFFRFRF